MGKCFFVAYIYRPGGQIRQSAIFEDAAAAIQQGKEEVEALLKTDRMFSDSHALSLEVMRAEFCSWFIAELSIQDGESVYSGTACLETPPSNIRAQTTDDERAIEYSDEFTGRENEIVVVWEEEFHNHD